jgi:hypothetical protein
MTMSSNLIRGMCSSGVSKTKVATEQLIQQSF